MLVIEENGVRLRLNIVDTPGYGDLVNNDRWYETAKLEVDCEKSNIRQLGHDCQVYQGSALGISAKRAHCAT